MRWRRLKAREGKAPAEDHTTGTREGFYMTLPLEGLVTPGEMAWLVLRDSDRIISEKGASCLTFWYYMRENLLDPRDEPSLGSLQVLLKKFGDSSQPDEVRPIWKLVNHQGRDWMYAQVPIQKSNNLEESQLIIEGMWGSSRPETGFIAIDDVIFYDSECEGNEPLYDGLCVISIIYRKCMSQSKQATHTECSTIWLTVGHR
jgi:hypothetical protein